MNDDPFYGQMPDGENPDIMLYIFPHLHEFLAIDLRDGQADVTLLKANDVFDRDFLIRLETEFSMALREGTDYPFAHIINLPLRLEDIVRTVATATIIEALGVDTLNEEELPMVMVCIVGGGALAMHSEKLVNVLRDYIGERQGAPMLQYWEGVISRLVREENQVLQDINSQELNEALRDDSPITFPSATIPRTTSLFGKTEIRPGPIGHAAGNFALQLIGLISDTHMAGSGRSLPDAVLEALAGVDLILHCGDSGVPGGAGLPGNRGHGSGCPWLRGSHRTRRPLGRGYPGSPSGRHKHWHGPRHPVAAAQNCHQPRWRRAGLSH